MAANDNKSVAEAVREWAKGYMRRSVIPKPHVDPNAVDVEPAKPLDEVQKSFIDKMKKTMGPIER